MRATIKNYIDALKARREELGEENDKGFSLIELIIVVVILGILAAIAIPIFLNIQGEARTNAARAVAANGATQAASQIAQGDPATLGNLVTPPTTSVIFVANDSSTTALGSAPTTIETICVYAVVDGTGAHSGPAC